MAEELKRLIGGTLLQRNKFYIVIYRGKDYLPSFVSTALAERQELADVIQTLEKKTRGSFVGEPLSGSAVDESVPNETVWHPGGVQTGHGPVGSRSDLGGEKSDEKGSRVRKNWLFKRIEHKFSIGDENIF